MFQAAGVILTVLITIIGLRMVLYWSSFFGAPGRYRARTPVSTARLRRIARQLGMMPYLEVQWTVKGSPGSTEAVLRGMRQLEQLAAEDPAFWGEYLTAELVTENLDQARQVHATFKGSPLKVMCAVTPADYQTPRHTGLKARQMHFLTELRRKGWNRKPGKTFIVHFDEDTLMVPAEFRKMAAHLAFTDKSILTGPIYYPLEYSTASPLARATEASRPITCWECRRVMETGVPLHVHGSNLVVERDFEDRVTWDIGRLNGETEFVAEDYMFGMAAFLTEGREAFGWHGCVALEQPPFSFASVYRQRFRWVFGVLQGMSVDTHLPEFRHLPWRLRKKVIWGTRYRIATYALGTVVGGLSLAYIPLALMVSVPDVIHHRPTGIPWELTAWFAAIGVMWLGTAVVGSWANTLHAGYTGIRRLKEIALTVCVTPVAGIAENMAAMSAVVRWMKGQRSSEWKTTPSTKAADDAARGKAVDHGEVHELPAPWQQPRSKGSWLTAAALCAAGAAITVVYIGYPFLVAAQSLPLPGGRVLLPVGQLLFAGLGITVPLVLILAIVTWTARASAHTAEHAGTRSLLADATRELIIPPPLPMPMTDNDRTDVMEPVVT